MLDKVIPTAAQEIVRKGDALSNVSMRYLSQCPLELFSTASIMLTVHYTI